MLKLKRPSERAKKICIEDLIEKLTVSKELLQKIQDRNKRNDLISRYYKRLAKEIDNPTLSKKSMNIKLCNSVYSIDRYAKAQIKDLKYTNLCHDRFCVNCRKIEGIAKINKYKPLLKPYNDVLYHLVLTVPNCPAEDLKCTIEMMNTKFRTLIQMIRGEIKIKDLDFSSWGYQGCIRALEVTYKKRYDKRDFHPHAHCLIALDHDTTLDDKKYENKYSRSRHSPDKVRLFSEQEVQIQKIWKLLMTDTKVTKKNIDALEIGYSCMIDQIDDTDEAIQEVMKYATKIYSEDNKEMLYEQFKILYFALKEKKSLQAYGVFYNKISEVTKEEAEVVDSIYKQVIEYLQKSESPVVEVNKLIDLILQDQYRLISRKTILRVLKDLEKDLKDLENYIDVPLLE